MDALTPLRAVFPEYEWETFEISIAVDVCVGVFDGRTYSLLRTSSVCLLTSRTLVPISERLRARANFTMGGTKSEFLRISSAVPIEVSPLPSI